MAEFRTLRIALLEDEQEQAARVSSWIVDKGFQCSVFDAADEFQRAFRKTSFDVVVLDWTLETGSSGLEVLHWIRKTLASDIPIIFVTARQAESDIVTALQAGADDYLGKPVGSFSVSQSRTSVVEATPVDLCLGNICGAQHPYSGYPCQPAAKKVEIAGIGALETDFHLPAWLPSGRTHSLNFAISWPVDCC